MNKIDYSHLGGFPLLEDDLEFEVNALTEAIKGLASVFQYGGSDPVILAGLVGTIVGSNTVYTDGYIAINSEIYFVTGATVPTSGGAAIDIAATFDTNGDKTMEDLTTQQTWIIRRGVLKAPTGAPTEIDITSTISIKDRLTLLGGLVDNSSAWVNVGSGGGAPAFAGTWANDTSSGGAPVRYRRNQLGELQLDGIAYIAASNTTGDEVIFVLPVGFRPTVTKVCICRVANAAGGVELNGLAYILPNGQVHVGFPSGTAYQLTVSLDNIRLLI